MAVTSCKGLKKKVSKPTKYEKLLFASIAGYVVVLSTITCLKHYCFNTFAFDFGIFIQVLWQSVHGNFMFTQPRAGPLQPSSFLGVHFSPLLIALIPLYALFRTPYFLLVLQSAALALPAYYIYRIGVRVTGDERTALLFAVGYLLYPGTLWSNWYDFHLEAFVPLFTSMAYHYYLKGSRPRLILSLALLLTTFERSVFIVISFAAYVLARELFKARRGGESRYLRPSTLNMLLVIVLASGLYFVGSERIMSALWPEKSILQLAKIVGKLSYENLLLKVSYMALLAGPLAFLPLWSPLELLPAAPYFFLAMATDYTPYFTIPWQYPALITIPFFASAIMASSREKPRLTRRKLAASIAFFFLLAAPGSLPMSSFSSNWQLPLPNWETALKHGALSSMEPDASVLAQEDFFPNIAERRVAYTLWPGDLEPPDYIVFDVLDYLFYYEPGGNTTRDQALRLAGAYGVAARVNGLVILKRGYAGPETNLAPLRVSLDLQGARKPYVSQEDSYRETRFFVPADVRVQGDHIYVAEGQRGSVFWGPYLTLPPGSYRVTVSFSADTAVQDALFDLRVYCYGAETYAERTVHGVEVVAGARSTLTLDFDLEEWAPSLE